MVQVAPCSHERLLRKTQACTCEALVEAMGLALEVVTTRGVRGFWGIAVTVRWTNRCDSRSSPRSSRNIRSRAWEDSALFACIEFNAKHANKPVTYVPAAFLPSPQLCLFLAGFGMRFAGKC